MAVVASSCLAAAALGVEILQPAGADSGPRADNRGAHTAFVTTWQTTDPNEEITIPGTGTYAVSWGDGSSITNASGHASHTYETPGTHTVSITGGLERINLGASFADAQKLRSIDQWGDIKWTSMERAFDGATYVTYAATDAPDLSGVTDMSSMFFTAYPFNGNLSSWDVSKVTDMGSMFNGAEDFNGDVSSWNVSQVTDMSRMFRASSFNGDISEWDVSSVTSMSNMFEKADAFNQPLSSWNVSQVTDMSNMFKEADAFNQPLSSWNVSQVTDMSNIFKEADAFNQPLSSWNVSQVTDMSNMFFGATAFNQPLSEWNVSQVTGMGGMFVLATAFNQPLSEWNVSQVTGMDSMFSGATTFNQDLSSWNVSRVINMGSMFDQATSFQQNLGKWYIVPADTAYATSEGTLNVTTVSAQNSVLDGHSPEYGIGLGDHSALFNMTGNVLTFKATPSAQDYTVTVTAPGGDFGTGNSRTLTVTVTAGADTIPPIITLNGSSAVTVTAGTAYADLGYSCADDTDDSKDLRLELDDSDLNVDTPGTYTVTYTCTDSAGNVGTATREVTVEDASAAFVTVWETTSPSESITFPGIGSYTIDWGDGTTPADVSGIQTHEYASAGTHTVSITGGLERINLSANATNAQKLQSIEQWGNTKWASMNNAFRGASDVTYAATDAPDLSRVADMSYMFYGAASFNGNLSSWDVSQVTNMNSMFVVATSFDGDLSSWNVSQVTDMGGMFTSTSFDGDLSSWDVSQVTYMHSMFSSAASFNQDISGWNVSQVTSMHSMFFNAASFNQDISGWNVSQVTSMHSMFFGAASFNQDISGWNVSKVTDMDSMFRIAASFNQDISGWDVSQVTSMHSMFSSAASFNQDISGWNVSQVTSMHSMFFNAASFNQDISGWDVSQVDNMSNMFASANSFQQNLGNWYVVPADTAYATSEGTLAVTTVSAQNSVLDGHSPEYGIGSGDDSALFNMTGSTLMFKAAPPVGSRNANVTASGGSVFEDGNNWRVLEITVTGADSTPPAITLDGANPLTIQAGTTYDDPGHSCADETDAVGDLRLELDDSELDVNTPGDYTVTYTCTDLSGNIATATRTVTVAAAETPADTTDPVITLNGPPALTITAGTTYTDRGATCTDGTDGSLQVTTTGTVDASALGTHTLAYTCTDSSGNESTATRQVRVVAAGSPEDNNPPRVNAGPDQTVGEGDTVALSGSVTDPDAGDAIESYSWSAPPGSGITFADGSSASTTFTAPAVDADATFTLTLTAGDGTDSGSDDVDVTVRDTGSAFITTWRTTSDNEAITIPGTGTYDVIWGDGTFSEAASGDGEFFDGVSGHVSHEYETPGTHTVSITGGLRWINLADNWANAQKLQSIEQWGGIKWDAMAFSFQGASNMVYNADDAPDLSEVADMTNMFRKASSFDGDLSSWDVSQATDMSGMFTSATAFDGDVSPWDVSSVTDMSIMFTLASSFDGDLSSWDVSSATGMDHMFLAANSFQQNLGNWYVVPADTAYATSEGTLNVTTVSAQNSVLDGHSPEYGIGSGGDSALFSMTGNALMFKDAPSVGRHPVNVTASGGSVFEGGNSWRMLEIAVAGTGTDTTPPTITLGGANPLTIQAGTTYDDPGYSCADETDAVVDLRLELNDSGLDVNTPGDYTVTYTCTDLSGNIAIATRGVEVVAAGPPADTTDPVITINGSSELTIQAGSTYEDAGATCTDDTDGSLQVTTTTTVNAAAPGTYAVTYACTDSSGNGSTISRTVTVVDTTDPVITLNGPPALTITVGTTYTERGAACTDNTDGSLTPITISGTVDTSNPGTYTVTYACTDSSGNGSTISRTVTVVAAETPIDTTDPVITINGSSELTITAGTAYTDQGATCTDETDTAPTVTTSGTVDTSSPGTYTVTYTCTDSSGNSSTATREVTVVDTTDPVITLNGPSTLTIQAGSTYEDAGAACTDDTDITPTVTTSGTVDTSSPGTYTVTYACTDSSGNGSTISRTVTVVDTTDPVITINGSSELTITAGTAYTDQGATCTDETDTAPTVTTSGTVDTSSPGTYTVTYTCTDSSGNSSTATREVTVVDTTDPVITINGSSELTITAGTAYTEQGATCTDETDGSLQVTTSGTVDTSSPGTYAVTYACTDSSGNNATADRIVFVRAADTADDTKAPEIDITGESTVRLHVDDNYVEMGARCVDDTDGTWNAGIHKSTVNTSEVGSYIVIYECADSSGNASLAIRHVEVSAPEENLPPVITLNGPSTVTVAVGSAFDDPGAACTDPEDGIREVTVRGGDPDTSSAGKRHIHYSCTDSDGETDSVVRTVTVQ